MMLVSKKFTPGTRVNYYGIFKGTVEGSPFAVNGIFKKTAVYVRWDETGDVNWEYLSNLVHED